MKTKLTLLFVLMSLAGLAQNRYYNLATQFDSVKVRKLIMTTIATGGATDSVLVKKPNGGMFKVARSGFGTGSGTVTSFGKTDGYGIISSVANSTTTPVHTVAVDSTSAGGLVSKARQTALNATLVHITGNETVDGRKKFLKALTIDTGQFLIKPMTVVPSPPSGYHSFNATTDGFMYRMNGVSQSLGFTIPSGGTGATWQTGAGTVAWTSDIPTFTNYTASGTGALTTIAVPHGLSGVTGTSKVIVQPLNTASAGVQYVTIDATNVNIMYTIAPASGSSNLSYSIIIKP